MKLHHVEKKWEGCLKELDEEFYNCMANLTQPLKGKPIPT